MRDFLNFLRSPKLSVPLISFALAFVVLGVIILKMHLSWYELTRDFLAFARSKETPELYVASPLEASFLDTYEELWPDTFNPSNPLRAARLPSFYSKVREMNRWELLSSREFDEVRQWAILMASGQIDQLKKRLKKPASGQDLRDVQECSVMMQETLFRVTQVWTEFEPDFKLYMDRCGPFQAHSLWFEFQRVLASGDLEALKAVSLKFQENMNSYPGKWTRWFALEAYQLAHIMVARQSEKPN